MSKSQGENGRNLLILLNSTVFFWEFYLNIRQLITVIKTKLPENYDEDVKPEIFSRSKQYSISKLKLWMVENVQRIIIILWILHEKKIADLWELLENYTDNYWKLNVMSAYILVTSIWVLRLPFRLYDNICIEGKMPFNFTNLLTVIWEYTRKILTGHVYRFILVSLISVSIIISFYIDVNHFYIVFTCLLVTYFQIGVDLIYSKMLIPIFHNIEYTKIHDKELIHEVRILCSQLGMPIMPIYVRVASKPLSEYVQVDLNEKKIIVDDVLMKFERREIVAAIAHRLSHIILVHHNKKMNIKLFNVFGISTTAFFVISSDALYRCFGFTEQHPEIIGYFGMYHCICKPLSRFYKYIVYGMSRQMEIEADDYVILHKKGNDLRSLVLKLWEYDNHFPSMDKLYKDWFSDHVSTVERLNNIYIKMNKFE